MTVGEVIRNITEIQDPSWINNLSEEDVEKECNK